MRLQPQTITLGEQSWSLRPLTVGQVQRIEPLLQAGAEPAATLWSAAAILGVALERDHPEAAARLAEVEAGAPEIARAMAVVLRLGGFLPAEGTAQGEVLADPSPASTGPRSIAD